ncbi:uncharacterized protein ACR2FA_000428 [Aphomia sociella]
MDTIQQSINSLMDHFNSKMSAFEQDLQMVNTGPVTVSSLAADFSAFRIFITGTLSNLQRQVELLANQMDQFEMRSRRKMLLIHGVQEHKDSRSSEEVVKIVRDNLKLSNFSLNDISRSQRLGRNPASKPRPILVKLRDVTTRDSIWYAKTGFKDTGITISEFLTKSRHDAFVAAREHFGLKKCWTRDGFVIIVGADGSKHRVCTIQEVDKLVSLAATVVAEDSPVSLPVKKTTTAATSRAKRIPKK